MTTLNTAISGLLAFQRALATTSHNIANVATPGYSRQVVDLSARLPSPTSAGFLGNGVDTSSINRMHDEFLAQQVWQRSSAAGQVTAFEALATRVSDMLADPNIGLTPALQDFFNALQDMADNPGDIPARQVVLSQAKILTDRFHSVDAQFDSMRQDAGEQMKSVVSDINSYATTIADLNNRIFISQTTINEPPNDLLDQRDLAIEELSKLVQVTTQRADNGAINIFIGNGQSLVMNSDHATLAIQPNAYDARDISVAVSSLGGTASYDVTDQLTGGKLGGLLDFQHGMLDTAQNDVGRIAASLSTMINDQHHLGMDLYNNLGADFFTSMDFTAPEVITNRNNTGSGVLTAQITDHTQLSNSDYVLSYSAGTYSLLRLSDNTTTNLGAAPPNQIVDGVNFTLSAGVMADGDSILIRPTRSAAGQINVAITQPQRIAAASPVRLNNSNIALDGSANITAVTDTTNAAFGTPGALDPPLMVRFLDATTYEIVRTDTSVVMETGIAYNPATGQDLFPTPGAYDPGYQIHLQGTFSAADSFDIEYNTSGSSDNRNALLLDSLRTTRAMINNSATLAEAYGQMVGRVGTETREAQLGGESQRTLLSQAVQQRDSVSGVNLDEEAANMVRYQQAYQAAAQVISVSRTMFDSLIATFR